MGASMHPEPETADRAAPDSGKSVVPPAGEPDPSAATPEVPEAAAAAKAAEAAAAAVSGLEDRLARAMADLDNMRKRHARELDRERGVERGRVATAWLPVVDNLERALEHADADPRVLLEGIRAVRDQALTVLNGLGYPRHDEVGVPFDPVKHEVVTVVDEPDAPPGTVVQVLRPGYGEADRQLRPGAVAVAGRRE
jgi:molecular chaperone GrpE